MNVSNKLKYFFMAGLYSLIYYMEFRPRAYSERLKGAAERGNTWAGYVLDHKH